MVIKVADMYIKIDTISVKPYVIGYDIIGGIAQPFPILDMRLHSADAVDRSVTIAQGSIVDVYACGQGTFMVEKVEREDNQLHILAVHSSAILRTKVSATGFTGQPEAIFSAIAQSIGYAVGDVVTTTTSYGSVTTLPGERLLDTIRYLSQLTGCRYMFDEKAYFRSVADMNSSTVNIGTATPNTYPIYRPSIDADSATLINSVKVVHELGEILDDDSTSITANGERFAEFRCLSTTTSAGVKPTADATAQAARILTDWKDKKVGLSYEISERGRDGEDKVWSQAYGHVSKGTITDALSGTTLTAVPLNIYHHKYPTFTSIYHWNAGGTDDISSELSNLWSDVDNMVYSGTVGNDLSSKPVALQVYGDQTLSEFDPAALTGFYLGKLKDDSGNDVYIWAGVDSGLEQVRMDTDGKLTAGGGRVILDASGMTTNDGTNTQIAIGTDGKLTAGAGKVVMDQSGMSIVAQSTTTTQEKIKWVDGEDVVSSIGANLGGSYPGSMYIVSDGLIDETAQHGLHMTTQYGSARLTNNMELPTPGGYTVIITANGLYSGIQLIASKDIAITAGRDIFGDIIMSGRSLNTRGCQSVGLPVYTPSTGYPSTYGKVAGDMCIWKDGGTLQILVFDGSSWRIEDL